MLVVSPAASSLRQLGGLLNGGCCVSSSANRCAQRVVSGAQLVVSVHLRFDVGSSVDSKASVAVWRRSCVDLESALGLFVGSCVDLRTACEDCSRNQFRGVDCFGNSLRVSRGGKDLIFTSLFYLTPFVSALL